MSTLGAIVALTGLFLLFLWILGAPNRALPILGKLINGAKTVWGFHPLGQFALWALMIALLGGAIFGLQSFEENITERFKKPDTEVEERPLFVQVVVDVSDNINTTTASENRSQALKTVLSSLEFSGKAPDQLSFTYFGHGTSKEANVIYDDFKNNRNNIDSAGIEELTTLLLKDLELFEDDSIADWTNFPYLLDELNRERNLANLTNYNFVTFIISDFLSDAKSGEEETNVEELLGEFRKFTTILDFDSAPRDSYISDGKFLNEIVLIDIMKELVVQKGEDFTNDLSDDLSTTNYLKYLQFLEKSDLGSFKKRIERILPDLRTQRTFSVLAEPFPYFNLNQEKDSIWKIKLWIESSSEALELQYETNLEDQPKESTLELIKSNYPVDYEIPIPRQVLTDDIHLKFNATVVNADEVSSYRGQLDIPVLQYPFDDRVQFVVENPDFTYDLIAGDSLLLKVRFLSRYNRDIRIFPQITSESDFSTTQDSYLLKRKSLSGTDYANLVVAVKLDSTSNSLRDKQATTFKLGFAYKIEGYGTEYGYALRNDMNYSWVKSEDPLRTIDVKVSIVSDSQAFFYKILFALGLYGPEFMKCIGFVFFLIVIFPHLYHLFYNYHILPSGKLNNEFRTFLLNDLTRFSIKKDKIKQGWSGIQVLGLLLTWIVLLVFSLSLFVNYDLLTHGQGGMLSRINHLLLAISLGICVVNVLVVSVGLSIRNIVWNGGWGKRNDTPENVWQFERAINPYQGLIRWLDRRVALEFIFTWVLYIISIPEKF